MQRASNHDLFVFMATSGNTSSTGTAFQILRQRGYSNAQMTGIMAMFAQVVRAGGDDFPSIPNPAGVIAGPVVVVDDPGIFEPDPQPAPRQPIFPVQRPDPIEPIPIEEFMPTDGEDLRDRMNGGAPLIGIGDDPTIPIGEEDLVTGGAGVIPVAAGAALAIRAALILLRRLMGSATTITRAHWDALPGWARAALGAVGFGVGVDLATEIPGVPGDSILIDIIGGGGGQNGAGHLPQHLVDGHLGLHIIGSWEANGVTFYRLSDGKLAVMNKKGRWKVWRPKKPVVLMPGGATNLKTLLKADRMLNAQAKKIATMLNRRAPRSKRASKSITVVQSDGKYIRTD